ncbi:rhamnogalacturonan acetylesterase RhgT [Alicyclobacillus cellulosilyticus]|uniref:Rhamnogalacturonan acetylesterase RhgT n=1 Tax=Alicyclobacillus cellulosilyticus TaxID=1003997 RepID=A0A917NGZ8_9BACL|nr:rhamnogalacturonan acetylesterase [Alicyclobacillus cellulosilyticus]GGJ00395.1 rhamnogalacturonan acetylesterase RhgT [Alicyclobacillus cellulosilyticus]
MSTRLIHVFLAGDSTMATYPPEHAPMAGWGQMFHHCFTNAVEIHNHAVCGRSSKSFLAEGRLEPILQQMQQGDYLFVQFGHNDAKPDPARYADPFTTYQECLAQFLIRFRQQGGQPILLTPVERRSFSEDGLFTSTHGDYPDAASQLAMRLNVPVIDLCSLSAKLYVQLGNKRSKRLFTWLQPGEHANYPEGIQDNTHFNEYGALVIAALVADAIQELQLPLAAYLRTDRPSLPNILEHMTSFGVE